MARRQTNAINIKTNEMSLQPSDSDPSHRAHLDEPPFELASWDSNFEEGFPEDQAAFRRSFLLRFIDKHSVEQQYERQSEQSKHLYASLSDPHSIRVFELLPGIQDDRIIHGRLHEVSIEFGYPALTASAAGFTVSDVRTGNIPHAVSLTAKRPVCYTALSYCWGSPQQNSSIFLDGQVKTLTDDLHAMLKHLRHPEHPVLLWIDQICIDQDDKSDKQSQVKLMGRIYSRAYNTIIWLGIDVSHGALTLLEGMYEATRYCNDDLLDEERQHLRHVNNGDHQDYEDLRDLLDRAWFKRTWIIQEATMSDRSYILAGDAAVVWSNFAHWCNGISTHGIVQPKEIGKPIDNLVFARRVDGLQVAARMSEMYYRHRQFSNGAPLLQMLVETRYAQATNPLDKVYALLGLCEHNIEPDYNKDKHLLYHEVAATVLKDVIDRLNPGRTYYGPIFQILCCVDHPRTTDKLPSWAPDWSKPRTTTSLGYSTFSWSCYDAGDAEGTYQECPVRLIGNDAYVNVLAKVAGTIESISAVFTDATLTETDPRHLNHGLKEAIDFCNQRTKAYSPEGIFLTMARTLVAGRAAPNVLGSGISKYPPDFTEIFSWLCDAATGKKPSVSGQTYTIRQQKGHISEASFVRRKLGGLMQNLKSAYSTAMLNRRLCWTRKAHLALVPHHALPGDLLCVFAGSPVPFVVRKRVDENYTLIGECYLDHVMSGQLARDSTIAYEEMRLA